MSHARKENHSKPISTTAKLISSAGAAILELGVFHPVDTSIKRLQINPNKIPNSALSLKQNFRNFSHVVTNGTNQFWNLYYGLGSGFLYKVAQRTYKYTIQDTLSVALKKKGMQHPIFAEACAGALTGAGEAMLLPLDTMKIRYQTKADSVKNKTFMSVLYKENIKLYRGFCITASRNTVGSFALFGGNQMMKSYVLKLEEGKKATLMQHFFTSIGGAVPSLIFSSPFDVVKTRINSTSGEKKLADGRTVRIDARSLFREILAKEGPSAFTKGLTMKLLTIGPKLTFSLGVTNFFKERVDAVLQDTNEFFKRNAK